MTLICESYYCIFLHWSTIYPTFPFSFKRPSPVIPFHPKQLASRFTTASILFVNHHLFPHPHFVFLYYHLFSSFHLTFFSNSLHNICFQRPPQKSKPANSICAPSDEESFAVNDSGGDIFSILVLGVFELIRGDSGVSFSRKSSYSFCSILFHRRWLTTIIPYFTGSSHWTILLG